jgi:hypothetical protein
VLSGSRQKKKNYNCYYTVKGPTNFFLEYHKNAEHQTRYYAHGVILARRKLGRILRVIGNNTPPDNK